MVAGAEHQDVTLAQPHTLRPLDRLELGTVDRLAGLEPGDSAMPRGIQQHAAADPPGRVGGDAAPLGAARGQDRNRLVVEEPAPPGDAVERVAIGVGVAVAAHAQPAHAEAELSRADRHVVQHRHQVHDRVRVVGDRDLADRDRHRDVTAAADEPCRSRDLLGRDVVERAALVVGTPAAPVLDALEEPLELGEADRCRRRQHACHAAASLVNPKIADRRERVLQPRIHVQVADDVVVEHIQTKHRE
mgnify:FL=1